MQKYIHNVWYRDSGKSFGTIITKKLFRQKMIDHYFNKKNPKSLIFKLTSGGPFRLILPYINRLGDRSICFVKLSNVVLP